MVQENGRISSWITSSRTIQPDTSRPSSHLVTGVVLRTFAAHRDMRKTEPAEAGAEFLSGRFFRGDAYVDRGTPEYWERVAFPFWFTDIVSALDSLSKIGQHGIFNKNVRQAIEWPLQRQTGDGLFKLKLLNRRSTPQILGNISRMQNSKTPCSRSVR